MNKITNQAGIEIISCGEIGSHIRNKDEYNFTIATLIQRIRNSKAWSDIQDTSINRDLQNICEDDNIDRDKWDNLIKSAWYYSDKY